jgi:uncharacterized coiled-coil DUF342 family protein
MDSWRIVIRPLLERNMLNAKEGEIILDKNTGHVTIKSGGKYKSKTKELEARVNALLGFKNELVKRYIQVAEEIEILVDGLEEVYKDTDAARAKADSLVADLEEISLKIDQLMTEIDNFCLEITNFQYNEIRPYLNPIVANLKDLMLIRANMDELVFLATDVKNQKISNKEGLSKVGGGY